MGTVIPTVNADGLVASTRLEIMAAVFASRVARFDTLTLITIVYAEMELLRIKRDWDRARVWNDRELKFKIPRSVIVEWWVSVGTFALRAATSLYSWEHVSNETTRLRLAGSGRTRSIKALLPFWGTYLAMSSSPVISLDLSIQFEGTTGSSNWRATILFGDSASLANGEAWAAIARLHMTAVHRKGMIRRLKKRCPGKSGLQAEFFSEEIEYGNAGFGWSLVLCRKKIFVKGRPTTFISIYRVDAICDMKGAIKL